MKTFWLVAMAVLVPGCVLTNPADPYAGMGRSLRAYPGAGTHPVVTHPVRGPLTLDEAVRVALANNPGVAATADEVDAAQAQRDLATGERLPSPHAVGGYNHYLDSQRVLAADENNQPGGFSRDIFGGDLVATMPLFTGGRITSEIKAAELLQKAAKVDELRIQVRVANQDPSNRSNEMADCRGSNQPENAESSCCGAGTTKTVLLYACSGGANVAEISDKAARELMFAGCGTMFCLAGLGADIQGMVQTARDADLNLVIDGCPMDCAKKIFDRHGLTNYRQIKVTDLGIEKVKGVRCTQELVDKVISKAREAIAGA